MKKGFTLVELLAVIIILGVILVIAIPSFNNAIKESKIKLYKSINQMVVKSTKEYLTEYVYELPEEEGETIEVTTNDLISNGYLKEISNPTDKNDTCTGYVLITKLENNEYSYIPHINCEENINNSTEDGLVLHYTFDDFQEPTVNLVNNPSADIIIDPIPGNYKPGWDINLHDKAIRVGTWGTGYNSGVPSPTIGYHAMWIYKNEINKTDPCMIFKDINDTYGLGHRWLGIAQTVGVSSSLGLQTGNPISVSWAQKSDVLGKGARLGLYHRLISTGTYSFESNAQTINVTERNVWERKNFTSTIGTDWDLAQTFRIYAYGNNGNYGNLYVDDVQIENKPYATPFVNGSRTGTVKDYSINNNNAVLGLAGTPRWIFDEERNSGAYYFDNKTITFGTGNMFFPLDTFSISAWIKTPGLGSGMSLNGIVSITYGLTVYINSSGNLSFRMDNGTSIPAITFTQNLHDNEFHHIFASFDGTNQKIYIDGELKLTSPFSGWTGSTRWPTNSAVIGQENNNGTIYRFNGTIDDFRLYNRALTDNEVRILYETTR